jgi:hypothetical protein
MTDIIIVHNAFIIYFAYRDLNSILIKASISILVFYFFSGIVKQNELGFLGVSQSKTFFPFHCYQMLKLYAVKKFILFQLNNSSIFLIEQRFIFQYFDFSFLIFLSFSSSFSLINTIFLLMWFLNFGKVSKILIRLFCTA